jgi:hypothetical protein
LSAYIEPGFFLSQTGHLAGPASQHLDLTAIDGYYFYPPGYLLVIALWVRLFGHGSESLLAFAAIAHSTFLIALWVLLRGRLGGKVWWVSLVVASVFAGFNHGRPDVIALTFATLAWIVIGDSHRRLLAAGLLFAAACLNSPANGLGACGAVAGFELSRRGLHRSSFLRVALLAAIMAAGVAGVIAAILTWQDSWMLARAQWSVHTSIRGGDLRSWPSFGNPYMIIYRAIPLAVLTFPMLATAVLQPRQDGVTRSAAVGYLIGAVVQLLLVPADFLTHRHLDFIGRPAFQAAQLGRPAGPA